MYTYAVDAFCTGTSFNLPVSVVSKTVNPLGNAIPGVQANPELTTAANPFS